MPYATVKLVPGVRVEQTPTLLTANIVASNNIRWRGGLPEKIGGWSAFYGSPINGIARALWAWQDINGVDHLAVASGVGADQGGITIITGGVATDVSPSFSLTSSVVLAYTITTTIGSSTVTITDPNLSSIVFPLKFPLGIVLSSPISIGGIILQGTYQVSSVITPDQYTILVGAAATSNSSTYVIPSYTTVAGSAIVTIAFPNHGLSVGSTWTVTFTPAVVGGIHFGGFYTVATVPDANHFTIVAPTLAASSTTVTTGILISYYGPQVTFGGGVIAPTGNWTLANFGSLLVAAEQNGPVFIWNPIGAGLLATIVANAPIIVEGIFVAMPQEMIVAYGASVLGVQDPMLVAWTDAGIYNSWIPTASNQAGSYRLTRGSMIVGGLQGPQQALLWTDVGIWVMSYVGYPNVWGFYEIAQGCGLIGQFGAMVIGSAVYWMGHSGFWVYSNGAVQPLPCEVWDVLFPDGIDSSNYGRIRAAANTSFNEGTWYYPSAAGNGENDSYVRFNVLTGEWDYGSLGVSAWIDDNIFGQPISAMINVDGHDCTVMSMETTSDANGVAIPWSYTTGFFALTEGEDKVFVDFIMPDFKWKRFPQSDSVSETISFTLYTQDYPDAAAGEGVATYGPYAVTSATGAIEVRCRGRYFSAQISGDDLNKWSRLGGIRFRYSPDGRN